MIESSPHLLVHNNFIVSLISITRSEAKLVGMSDHLACVVTIERVEDIEEVGAIWTSVFRILVWQVKHQLGVLPEKREQVLHAKFVVVGNHDELDQFTLHQLLLATKNLTNKVLGAH